MVVYLLGVSEKHQPNSRHSVRQRPLCLRLPSHTSWRRELFSFFLFYLQQITLQSLKKKVLNKQDVKNLSAIKWILQ